MNGMHGIKFFSAFILFPIICFPRVLQVVRVHMRSGRWNEERYMCLPCGEVLPRVWFCLFNKPVHDLLPSPLHTPPPIMLHRRVCRLPEASKVA